MRWVYRTNFIKTATILCLTIINTLPAMQQYTKIFVGFGNHDYLCGCNHCIDSYHELQNIIPYPADGRHGRCESRQRQKR